MMNLKQLRFAVASVAVLGAAPVRANLMFNLIPDPDTPQFAIDGFNAGAILWSSVLGDNITINVQIGFKPLNPGVLGDTDSEIVERNYPQVVQALTSHSTSAADFSAYSSLQVGTTYNRLVNHTSDNPNGPNSATPYLNSMDRVGITTANAKVLGLAAPSDATDATIRFNSDFPFDFSHDDITPGQFDFVGIAAHEIGHALGFISGVDDIDELNGTEPAESLSSNLLDLFRHSALSLEQGAGYTDYTADTRDKYFSVDGGNTAVALFATGITYGDGRQASHWKDNLGLGLMDPTAAPGEKLDIGQNDLLAFDVMGYTPVPEPSVGVLFGAGVLLMLLHCRRPARVPQRPNFVATAD